MGKYIHEEGCGCKCSEPCTCTIRILKKVPEASLPAVNTILRDRCVYWSKEDREAYQKAKPARPTIPTKVDLEGGFFDLVGPAQPVAETPPKDPPPTTPPPCRGYGYPNCCDQHRERWYNTPG